MPANKLKKLSFVPLPLLTTEDKYSKFRISKVKEWMKETTHIKKAKNRQINKAKKDLLVSSKVQCTILCQEWLKATLYFFKE